MEILWTPRAKERLKGIFEYIVQDNPAIARDWVLVIRNRVDSIGDHPHIGRVVPEYDHPKVREVIHGDYRIIYRLANERIEILTVRHCSQLLPLEAFEL